MLLYILRDALGEFIAHRRPVMDYVYNRYPEHGGDFHTVKIGQVARRNLWAGLIKSGRISLEK